MPASQDDNAVPLCGSDDLAVVVSWEHDGAALEEKIPPYVVLEPGQRAASRVHWGSCCGQASDRARVDWPGGSAVATVHGPTQPECSPAQSDNLTTSWFHLMT